jgi:hypothetical protein
MDLEQDAYDTVKKSWKDVLRKTQEWCKKAAKPSGTGSYMLLKGCVEQTAAREENATHQSKTRTATGGPGAHIAGADQKKARSRGSGPRL